MKSEVFCKAVRAILDKGQANAIHAIELCDRFGITLRELRLVMAALSALDVVQSGGGE